jgi:hypothetical protein
MRFKVKTQVMRNQALLPLITLLGVAGCHKTDSAGQAQPPAATQDGQLPSAAPRKAGGSPSVQATGPLATAVGTRAENAVRETADGEVNPSLTRQLQIFVQETGRLPQSFIEFANARLDGIPRPPGGKKWAIDSRSTEVKAVNVK